MKEKIKKALAWTLMVGYFAFTLIVIAMVPAETRWVLLGLFFNKEVLVLVIAMSLLSVAVSLWMIRSTSRQPPSPKCPRCGQDWPAKENNIAQEIVE